MNITELVGAVRRTILHTLSDTFDIPGFGELKKEEIIINPHKTAKLADILKTYIEFVPRDIAEEDPAWKQIIPYIVVTNDHQVFTTHRLKKSSESRLHGTISLGLGGHINLCDKYDSIHPNPIWAAMWRELDEEVRISHRGLAPYPIGVVSHDDTPLGQVHLGILFRLHFSDPNVQVQVRETNKLRGEFKPWNELTTTRLERWAELIYEERKNFT